MRLVLVEWLDSFGCSSEWQELGTFDPRPVSCRSVGWLLHDGEECKVIVPHVTSETEKQVKPQGCGDMTIPTKSITSITDISSN